MRRPSGIFSDHLNNPEIDAALAGSTKIPSLDASQLCAAKISSSVTTSISPFDSSSAAHACFQLAGLPIRIAEAIVSGFATILSWKIGAAPAAWKPIIAGNFVDLGAVALAEAAFPFVQHSR